MPRLLVHHARKQSEPLSPCGRGVGERGGSSRNPQASKKRKAGKSPPFFHHASNIPTHPTGGASALNTCAITADKSSSVNGLVM